MCSSAAIRPEWLERLVSAVQVLAAQDLPDSTVAFRTKASEALATVEPPVSELERVIARGLLLPVALRSIRLSELGLVLSSLGARGALLTRAAHASRPVPQRDLAEATRQVIDREYATPLTVTQLSRRLHVHRNMLSQQFRRAFSISIPKYVELQRILRAASLLRDQQMLTVDAIAASVGYKDKLFYRHFARLIGMTPGAFRVAAARDFGAARDASSASMH